MNLYKNRKLSLLGRVNNKVFERKIIPSNDKNLSWINRESLLMFINYTSAFKYIIFIAFLGTSSGCENSKNESFKGCKTTDEHCLILKQSTIEIMINTDEVLVENLYQFVIKSEENITKLAIEGISMNMGVLPIQLQKSDTDEFQYSGRFILGICSQPDMQWQFIAKLSNSETIRIPFNSKWHSSL
ncbi:MAG: hypothetical protein HWE10_07995 [Gammaproteobacteria bacterium]|nr:hypothetical protein [Gammaproteobacteria bacterium]